MDGICNRLLSVKGMVVEDACIVDSPLRPVPVLEVRPRPRGGMLRCSRCGRRRHGYDRGGGVRRWRHQDFGCRRVELVAALPRVDCPRCGVTVASVPWAEPGSRFTRDFEAECAWPMTVANRKTVGGFLHIAWRTAGDVARRVAERVKASMPSPFDGLTAIGVDGTSHKEGPHVPGRGRRPRAASGHPGARRVRQGRVRPVLQGVDARTARLHQGRHRRRGPLDRPVRRRALPERRTRIGRVPHRLLDDRRARQGQETPVEPGEARRGREDHGAHARRQVRGPEEPRRPDRQTGGGVREHQKRGSQGPALPRMAAQGTPAHPAQTPPRTGPRRN